MTESQANQTKLVAIEAGGTGAAQIFGAGLRYISILFTTRILGASAYGAYTLALTVTGIVNVISVLGLSPGVLPFLSKARKRGDDRAIAAVIRAALGLVLAASLVCLAGVILAAPWLASAVFQKPAVGTFLKALSALVILGALLSMVLTLIQGFMAVKERAWIERVAAVGVTTTGMGLTWFFGWGIPGVVASALTGPAVGLFLAFGLLRRKAPNALSPGFRSDPLPTGKLFGYSWPLMGTTMLSFLLLWTDLLLMGVFRESSEVGIYGVCTRIAPAILLVHESVGPVFAPMLSDLFTEGKWDGIRHLYRLTARWSMWPGLVMAWGLVLWGKQILGIFGPEFAAGAAVLAVLAAAKGVSVATGMCGKVLGITGKARLHLVNMILLVGGNLALNLVWIPRYGGLGAACATCVSLFAVNALQTFQVWFFYRMLPWDRRSLLPILGPAALAALAFPFRDGLGGSWGWVLPALLFSAACGILFLRFGFNEDDRSLVSSIRSRMGSRNKTL